VPDSSTNSPNDQRFHAVLGEPDPLARAVGTFHLGERPSLEFEPAGVLVLRALDLLAVVLDRLAHGVVGLRPQAAGVVERLFRAADRVAAVGPGVLDDPVQRPGVLAVDVAPRLNLAGVLTVLARASTGACG
jgi:hypothetical protein